MKNSRKGKIQLSQKQKLQWGGAGILILAAIVMTTTNSSLINNDLMKINENEIFFMGSDFENQEAGDFINEGTVVYTGHINTIGKFNCGTCLSGSNYVRSDWGNFQTISGDGIVQMQDVIIENTGGIDLEIEWQITNSMDFVKGLIRTDRDQGGTAFVHFQPGSIVVSAADEEHIDGYVAKTGKGDFILPTGDGSRLMPVMITGSAQNSFFKAAYYHSDPNNGSLYAGGPFFTQDYEVTEVSYVHNEEFWHIEGNSPTQIVLPWDQTTDIQSWAGSKDSIIVVGWKDNKWMNLGNLYREGNLLKGKVTSRSVVPDDYEAFALGKMNPAYKPVVYLSFDAVQKGDDGYLTWSTTREINSFYFDVERSIDAVIFEKFGQVQAGGNTDTIQNYDFWDEEIALKDLDRVFYRIRQVDLDGRFVYSHVEELVFGEVEEEIELVIYPNPVIDILRVRYTGRAALNARLKIVNMLGQSVHEEALQGSSDLEINVTNLAVGHYVVIAGNQDIQVSKRLIIAR